MSPRRWIPIALAAALLYAACDLNVKQHPYSGIWVYGVVYNEASAPVAGVQIRVGYLPMAACSTAGFSASALTPATDSLGRYGVGIVDYGTDHDVCVKLVAMPPSTQALAEDSVLVRDVTLTQSMADSLHVDFVLPPQLQSVAGATAVPASPKPRAH